MSTHKNAICIVFSLLMALAWTANAAQTCRSEGEIPSTTPASRFTDHGDGTVTDNQTGLMWAKCAEGLSGSNCATGADWSGNWQAALDRAASSSLAGHSDWRLPNIKELRSIVEERCYNPSINLTVFPGTPASSFWSASPTAYDSIYAWDVYFYSGYTYFYGRSRYGNWQVRLVRSGQ